MGYVVTWEVEVDDITDIKELRKAIANRDDDLKIAFEGIEVTDSGDLDFLEYGAKYYGDDWDKLCDLIAPYFRGSIYFTGEDGEKWRILFKDGKSCYQQCTFIYGEPLQWIIENETLPEDVKKILQQIQTARRI